METQFNPLTYISNTITGSVSANDNRSLIERSISILLLALICVFALNSIGNVQKYVSRFHDHWTGDALGVAFGTVVFVCAYIAATTHSSPRWVAIVIGSIFGIASAHFQTELYTLEGMSMRTALILSYIPILAGEVGLALLESLYSRQHRAEQNVAENDQLSAQLMEQHNELAMLEAQLQAIVQERDVAREELETVATTHSELLQTIESQAADAQVQQPITAIEATNNATDSGDLHLANETRAANKEQKKLAVLQLLQQTNRAIGMSDLTEMLQKTGLEVSVHSVRRYCLELASEELITNNNRKWQAVAAA